MMIPCSSSNGDRSDVNGMEEGGRGRGSLMRGETACLGG